jgi:transposase
LRTLLVHGARSVIVRARKREDEKDGWLKKLLDRRHVNIATVALAHKTVRTVWAMLAHDREYCPNYKSLSVAA